eukprot:scaffold1347_cov350-Pavlova_lutheri.AAC.74
MEGFVCMGTEGQRVEGPTGKQPPQGPAWYLGFVAMNLQVPPCDAQVCEEELCRCAPTPSIDEIQSNFPRPVRTGLSHEIKSTPMAMSSG